MRGAFENILKKFSPNLTPANVLGLGWACTPAGLKAMQELADLEAQRGIRSIWRPIRATGLRRQTTAVRERAGTGVPAMRCASS